MFYCHSCGQCCKSLSAALASAATLPKGSALYEAGAAFPHEVLPDGSCSQLQADNKCAVYLDRPLLCDVDQLFDAMQLPDLTREVWYELNAAACPPK